MSKGFQHAIELSNAEAAADLAQLEELIRSNAQWQAFAYSVAHDLREPLRTISTFTQILVRRAQLGEADRELAHFIVDGVQRMGIVLDELLSSATYGSGRSVSPVSLEGAAGQAIQNLREAITSSGAAIQLGPLPVVQGNECDLIRLFQNLIANAIKYRSAAPVQVYVSAARLGSEWVLRVRDNGMGIAKEDHKRVFDLFTRLHPEALPGSGIGLAVCKKIVVDGLGGAIWLESEPGVGSTFCFTIPDEQPTDPRG
jgi:light-regulated signal transduction histidine kinase (bacteriophytochrome)